MKKQLLAVFCSALMVLGFGAVASAQSNTVATVSTREIAANVPAVVQAAQAMDQEIAKSRAEFEKSVNDKMTQEEVAKIATKLNDQLVQKEQALFGPIQQKISKAVSDVAAKKGYKVVLADGISAYVAEAPVDITKEVIAAIK